MPLYKVSRIYFVHAVSQVDAVQQAVEQEIPNSLIVEVATTEEAVELKQADEAAEKQLAEMEGEE